MIHIIIKFKTIKKKFLGVYIFFKKTRNHILLESRLRLREASTVCSTLSLGGPVFLFSATLGGSGTKTSCADEIA